jgi:hypothetical protein
MPNTAGGAAKKVFWREKKEQMPRAVVELWEQCDLSCV